MRLEAKSREGSYMKIAPETKECAICRQELSRGDFIVFSCHCFHRNCLLNGYRNHEEIQSRFAKILDLRYTFDKVPMKTAGATEQTQIGKTPNEFMRALEILPGFSINEISDVANTFAERIGVSTVTEADKFIPNLKQVVAKEKLNIVETTELEVLLKELDHMLSQECLLCGGFMVTNWLN